MSSEEIKFAIRSQFQHTLENLFKSFSYLRRMNSQRLKTSPKIPSGNSSNGNDWNSFDFLSPASIRLIKSEKTLQRKMCSRHERHNTSHYHWWHRAEDFRCYLFCVFNPETNDRLIATLSQGGLFSISTVFQKEKRSWNISGSIKDEIDTTSLYIEVKKRPSNSRPKQFRSFRQTSFN